MTPSPDRRRFDRRFTDTEIEEILEHARGYQNGMRKRQMMLGVSMATLLGISTLVNVWVIAPLKEDITTLKHEMYEIDKSVRLHHEAANRDFVSKDDEAKVHAELQSLERKVDRLVERLLQENNKK